MPAHVPGAGAAARARATRREEGPKVKGGPLRAWRCAPHAMTTRMCDQSSNIITQRISPVSTRRVTNAQT